MYGRGSRPGTAPAADAPLGTPACPGEHRRASRRRYRSILMAVLSALCGKGTSLIVNAITIPLTVRYLGNESYGLWVTISSTVTMYFVLDIGIANTLTNLISEAFARDDRDLAASYATTAFWLISGIAALLGAATWLVWPWIHWGSLFHVQDPALVGETSRTVAIASLLFLAALPTGLATRILAGYQEVHLANWFATGGSMLSFLAVIAVVYRHGSLPVLVAAYAGSPVAANACCLLWIWIFHKPWLRPWPKRIRTAVIGRIFHSGGQFFVVQMAGLVVANSDNLVISHYLSPAAVTPYNIAWRLVSYFIGIQAIVFPAVWPAYSEAYARGDLSWVRKTYSRMRRMTLMYLAAGVAFLLLFGQQVIKLWAGPAAVPSLLLTRLMCVWMVLSVITINQACLMGATGRVMRQAVASGLAAAVNLVLSIWWVRSLGPPGVLLGTIVSYSLFIVTTQAWEVGRILRPTTSARWLPDTL